MTKLFSHKALKGFAAIALSILLVVALMPPMQAAYGSSESASAVLDLPVDDIAADETADKPTTDDADSSDVGDGEAASSSGAADEAAVKADADEADKKTDDGAPAADTSAVSDEAVLPTVEELGEVTSMPAQAVAYAVGGEGTENGATEGADGGTKDGNRAEPTQGAEINITASSQKLPSYEFSDGKSHTLNVAKGVTLTVGESIHVTNGTTLTITGQGTIDGGKKVGSVIHVEGGNSKLVLCPNEGDNVTITGGNGGTELNDQKNFGGYFAGGGILVERTKPTGTGSDGVPATLEMCNGTVSGNTAGAGGGIYVDRGCSFTMHNGTVSGNTATTYEGGGIYVGCAGASIEGGVIDGNTTATTVSWGGGGIFVESKGVLRLGTSLITQNTANGLGGGISGCPHASIGIGSIEEGYALFGNTAKGKVWPNNQYLNELSVTYNGRTYTAGDKWAKADAGFTADKAMDYYCTNVSYIKGYGENLVAWTGRAYGDGTIARDITVYKGESLVLPGESLGLTSTFKGTVEGRAVTITNNTSNTHGGGIGCNGTLIVGNIPTGDSWAPLSLLIAKRLQNSEGDELPLEAGQFAFELVRDGKVVAEGENDADGRVLFSLAGEPLLEGIGAGQSGTIQLTLREKRPSQDDGTYTYAEDVRVSLTVAHDVKSISYPNATLDVTEHIPSLVKVTYDPAPDDGEMLTMVNTLNLAGAWMPEATKYFYGTLPEGASCSFSLKEIGADADIDPADIDLAGLLAGDGPVYEGVADDFDKQGVASVKFEEVPYTKSGTYWYLMTEDGVAGQAPGDPTVYAFKVQVTVSQDKKSLEAKVASVYFAASPAETTLTLLTGAEPRAEFYNSNVDLALYSYAVYAMSNEPVDQKCLVDPKIYKKLEGRSLRADEFHFQLIQVNDYTDTDGTVISATGNDQYGMVDFDAAANVAGEGEDPCCLLFTAPGTYYYRVVEDASYQRDPSVSYSDEVITFTAVIALNEATGVLECTDMYYGQLVNGENVRFEESADPTWHPTITNTARPMDLRVRKTSVLDRTEGLEGATYALYLVNDNAQGDIYLGEAVSDSEGWLTYRDVSLSAGNLYYFKETAAPAGHTVSEFRSPYFYLVADEDSVTGYVMRYTDTKALPALAETAAPMAEDASSPLAVEAIETAEVAAAAEARNGESADGADAADAGTTTAPEFDADGTLVLTYENDGGVSDEATNVAFNKLDTRTHEWVEGAALSIVEKDTGTVVHSWTSGAAPEKLQKVLNVGTTYILREDEAPTDYEKAADVEFVIDQYGKVSILSGADNGNAELSDATITLYDTMIDAEEVVTEEQETVREVPGEDKTVTERLLAKTGDALSLGGLALLALGSLIVAGLALHRRRNRVTSGKHIRR